MRPFEELIAFGCREQFAKGYDEGYDAGILFAVEIIKLHLKNCPPDAIALQAEADIEQVLQVIEEYENA